MDFLSKTSIRGRFAIGLYCSENLAKRKGLYHNDTFKVIIEKLAEFTNRKDLDYWDSEISAYLPKTFKTAFDENINDLFYNELVEFYNSPEYINFFEIIELCANIGNHHIYGRITNNSPETFKMIIKILDKTEIQELNFQKLSEKYPIKELNGWGERFKYNSFRPK